MSHADPSFRPEAWIEHREFVRALARRLLADEHAAEDVAQEACIAALESPPRSSEAARAWLSRVVRNLSLNVLRERTRRERREKETARAEACDAGIDARIHAQRHVLAAVTALREPYKTAIWMRWYEGLPPREIARRLDVPVETVKSRLKRGLAELQLALDHEFGDRERWMRALAPLCWLERPALVATTWLVAACVCVSIAVIWSFTDSAPSRVPSIARADVAGAAIERPRSAASSTLERAPLADRRVGAILAVPPSRSPAAPASAASVAVAAAVEAVGPHFELDFDPPAGLSRGDFDCALELDGVAEAARETQVVPVTSEPLPRIRFDHVPRTSLLGGGARTTYALTLASRDGLWRAAQHVPALGGDEVRRVRFVLDARAAVAGVVRDPAGIPVANVVVRVRDSRGERIVEAPTSSTGRFEFSGLAAGTYDVDARSIAGGGASASVALQALERRDVDLALGACVTTALEGRLSSRTGLHVPRGVVRLASVEDPRLTLSAIATPDPDSASGDFVFRFEALAPGTYEVIPPMDDAFAWNPPFAVVTSPCRALAFTCVDDVPVTEIVLRAVESETGRAIAPVRATILLDRYGLGRKRALALEPHALHVEAPAGEARFSGIPAGMTGWWLVEADGQRSAWGELAELTRRAGRLETEARLEPAWTAHLWIVTRDEFGDVRPLPGARILTRGGATLAQSLESGEAFLDLLFDPGRIGVELAGWRVASMEGFANGKLRQRLDVHRIWMVRE